MITFVTFLLILVLLVVAVILIFVVGGLILDVFLSCKLIAVLFGRRKRTRRVKEIE